MKIKLVSYRDYARRGLLKATYGQETAALLIVTTGKLRKRHIERYLGAASPVSVAVQTSESLSRVTSFSEVRFQ